MTTLNTRKQTVGMKVFETFEKDITGKHFEKGIHTERILAAAELAEVVGQTCRFANVKCRKGESE